MLVELRQAGEADAHLLWKMQIRSFEPILQRYHNDTTSPARETEEMLRVRLRQSFADFYVIRADGEDVGGVRVVRRDGGRCRIAPLFVLPQYQRQGIAQSAMRLLEEMYPDVQWELNTILEEAGHCRLYEKLGFVRTGEYEKINERMTLVYYRKLRRNGKDF